MAFIRRKAAEGGRSYFYLVESRRDGPGGSPRQRVIEYIGDGSRLRALALAGRGEASELAARALARYGTGEAEGGAGATEARTGEAAPTGGPAGFRCFDHGAWAALWKAATLVGLEGAVDGCLPAKTVKGMSRGRVLALAAIHRAVDPGSKASFAGWCARTTMPHHLGLDPAELDSQAFWEAMDGISEEDLDAAQRELVSRLRELFPGELSELQLDYTNYHTWIDTRNQRCVICQRGHDRQKRSDLRQFALAMLTARALPVPLVWELYEGNVNDKAEFPLFSGKVARELGDDLEGATVSFDGGGNSEAALSSLPFHFVCAHSLSGMGHLLDVPLSEYEDVDLGGGRFRRAHRVDGLEFSGVTGTGVLTLSDDLRRGQEAELERREERLAKRASALGDRLSKPRSSLHTRLRRAEEAARQRALAVKGYNAEPGRDRAEGKGGGRRRKADPPAFDADAELRSIVGSELFGGLACLRGFWSFDLRREAAAGDGERQGGEGDGSGRKGGDVRWVVALERDDAARDAYRDREFGKKLTVTDRTDWATEEILAAYAGQECVEDLFKTTKRTDHFSVRPQFHWTDDKIRVHVFVCLCSVMLAEVLARLVSDAGVAMSKAALLDALGGVHEGWVRAGGATTWATEDLRGQERRVWDAVLVIPGTLPGESVG